MKYRKEPLSFEEQADILLKRGLQAKRTELTAKLAAVNYYRLSAYWYTFRQKDSDQFLPDTNLETVWQRYVFDRHLRLHAIDAIERIEIAIRTQIVNLFTLQYGAFGHLKNDNLPNLSNLDHSRFIKYIRDEMRRSREEFVEHYEGKYSSEKDLPLWMACELMTFGGLFTLFRGLKSRMQKDVAQEYGVPAIVLESWLGSINYVRNLCAHHARLWNRVLGVKPTMPKQELFAEWAAPDQTARVANDRAYTIFTIFYFLLQQIAPQSRWKYRLIDLFEQYEEVPKEFMGFPPNWQDSPIWQD